MDFIVDAMLPLKLSDFLNSGGHNSIHTLQLPNQNSSSDIDINQLSITQNRVVITKDSDFEDDIRIKKIPYKLLLIKTGNISNHDLLGIFSQHITSLISTLENNIFVELNSTGIISHF